MKPYDQVFTLETNKSTEEIIQTLNKKTSVHSESGNIIIDHNPAWYKIFSPRGTIRLIPGKQSSSFFQAVISPTIINYRTMLIFLLCNIPLWIGLVYFFPWNILLIVVFFVEWLIISFIAFPILFFTVVAMTIYILWVSVNWPNVFFILVCWGLLFLSVNAALRYNRGELKRWLIRALI